MRNILISTASLKSRENCFQKRFHVAALLLRMPFTIAMLTVVIGFGWLSNSLGGTIDPVHRHMLGSSLQRVLDGEHYRLFTSLFLTSGGWHFFASVLMLAVCVGWAEITRGTVRTILVYFAVHLLSLAVVYFVCVLPLAAIQIPWAELLVDARDVGPSAGYYGCLGFAAANLPGNRGWRVGLAVLTVLAVRLLLSATATSGNAHLVIGDLAHLVSLPLGLWAGYGWFPGKSVARLSSTGLAH